MATLKQLNISRGAISRQLTRFQTFLASEDAHNLTQVKVRLSKLKELWNKFDEVQRNIEALNLNENGEVVDQAASVQNDEAQAAFEDKYFRLEAEATDRVSERDPISLDHTVVPNNLHTGNNEQHNNNIPVKLPSLSLPTFNGHYDHWLLFRDSFCSLIHNNEALPPIQKFQYLRSSLRGEALQTIQSLKTCAESYEIAWTLLLSRFDNQRLIINTHLKELLEFAPFTGKNHITLRQFIDNTRAHLRALEALGQPVKQWDAILIHLITNKLDFSTRKEWETKISSGDWPRLEHNSATSSNETQATGAFESRQLDKMPSMEELLKFLEERCLTLEMLEGGNSKQESTKYITGKRVEKRVALTTTAPPACGYCTGRHFIFKCNEFLKLPVSLRLTEARNKQLCINCLKAGHYQRECKSSNCRKCSKPHNTLLHFDTEQTAVSGNIAEQRSQKASTSRSTMPQSEGTSHKEEKSTVTAHCARKQQSSHILLATAQVYAYDVDGKQHKCRVLLDPASQANLVTIGLMNKLGLPTREDYLPITGVNQTETVAHQSARIKIKSIHSKFTAVLDCWSMSKITEKLPQIRIEEKLINIPEGIKLADPMFSIPGEIDLLIGGGLFWDLLRTRQITQAKGLPTLHETQLGWIIGGEMITPRSQQISTACHLITKNNLEKRIERFWMQEEVEEIRQPDAIEEMCEHQFMETHKRDPEGRFIVKLPQNPQVILGDSKQQAIRRLTYLERKLNRNSKLKKEYINFLDDYESQGHMTRITEEVQDTSETYFIPHQAVWKQDSLTTKLRVVFDASTKTTLGTSLNDRLLPGPNLQGDLLNIILRFRTYKFAITADIEKMFRQVLVNEQDRSMQRILWRKDTKEPIQLYVLNTVTYGTSCAPFLAMRCLRQLAAENRDKLPLAARAVEEDLYMDDLLTGVDNITEAEVLIEQLNSLMAKGKFKLRKWRSNESQILESLSQQNGTDNLLVIEKEEVLKTLGLLWDAESDNLLYKVQNSEEPAVTKRGVLSKIAQIFDPLGFIGPVIINAKLIMQRLWQANLNWDEPLTDHLRAAWEEYYDSLPKLNDLRIPRSIYPASEMEKINLFGFGDASEKAIGACVYAASINSTGNKTVYLLCSKSKVAPLKTISLPKLELNAALLLSKLVNIVQKALGNRIADILLWSDSTIVLGWIKTPAYKLKTFVANRVTTINRLTSKAEWYHLPSKENPADLLSRGVTVENLMENKQWWNGPEWIRNRAAWPEQPCLGSLDIPELKTTVLTVVSQDSNILTKFSSYHKLRRVIAYCLRFGKNTRGHKKTEILTVEELNEADFSIAKWVQREAFHAELKVLERQGNLDRGSKLIALNPFLDKRGILRVGGRIRRADISADQKHPIVLPARHFVTHLLMKAEHIRLLHCGPEQLLSAVRQRYWPLSGRREAQKITRSCLHCFRYKPKITDTLMADLPKSRVTGYSRPFAVCGVDYAGPLQIRDSRRRGRVPISKGYIAVFICFSTKAIHLELVSNLSSEAFIATLRRFIARRGMCNHLYSDNGTNFVGAERELREMYELLSNQQTKIADFLAERKIEWHFIPPRAPHFGGLWEAAVKMTKRHLYTVTRGLNSTFEEYSTLLTEIEAILNSRPLVPNSNDPNDLTVLTPSHFLIGDSLIEPAQPDLTNIADTRLSRWQHLQKVRQHFWRRWHSEYLSLLQARKKWATKGENLQIGSMVLVMEDNTPPLCWSLGRIETVHPGEDGTVRVVTVRTQKGLIKRPTKKVCPLPEESITST